MTDTFYEDLKVIIRHRKLAARDLGRLQLLLSFHDKTPGDPAPDWSHVINEYHKNVSQAESITAVPKVSISQDEMNWLLGWAEYRKELLKRIAFYEKRLGIDRKTYSIDGHLISDPYYRGLK